MTRRGALVLAATGVVACTPRGSTRTIRLIIGTAPGGGNDIFCRLLAQHLRQILGRPVQVENEGRASGRLAASRLMSMPRDGSVIGFLPAPLIYENLLSGSGAATDLTRFSWLGSIGTDRRILVVNRQSGIISFADMLARSRPTILAASSATSASYVEPLIINHLTGANLKPVPGYSGGARTLAVVSGEADGVVGGQDSLTRLLETPGTRRILRLNDPSGPDSSDVPNLADLARGPDRIPLLGLISACASLGRMFALPPGASPAVLARWRGLLDRVVADPSFRQAATDQGFTLERLSGAGVSQALAGLFDTSSAVTPALRRALGTTAR